MANISKKVRESFVNAETLAELKRAYVTAMLKYRMNGKIEIIDGLYIDCFDEVKDCNKTRDGEIYVKETEETASFFLNAIHTLKGIKGIDIEMVGSWLWVVDTVEGSAKENRETLKMAGCKYAPQKKQWYIAPMNAKRSKEHYEYSKIKEMFEGK